MVKRDRNDKNKRGISFLNKYNYHYKVWLGLFVFGIAMAFHVYQTNKIRSLGVKYNQLLVVKQSLIKELELKESELNSQMSSAGIEYSAKAYLGMKKDTSKDLYFVVRDKHNLFTSESKDNLPDLYCALNNDKEEM